MHTQNKESEKVIRYYAYLFDVLNKFYEDDKKEMISNSCVVNNGHELQKDIEKINNLDNIDELDVKTIETIERLSKFLAPIDRFHMTTIIHEQL